MQERTGAARCLCGHRCIDGRNKAKWVAYSRCKRCIQETVKVSIAANYGNTRPYKNLLKKTGARRRPLDLH